MATAGEAASLFGAADSANDPFALPPPEEPQPTGNDPFANVQPTTEAADLFGYAAPQEPTQTSQQGYTPSHVAAEGTSTNWNGSSVQQAASSSSQDPYAYAPQNTYVSQAATNGWNETHSQWSGYNAQQQYASANGAYTNGSYAQAAPVHDPYASQTNYAYAPSKAVSPSTTQPSTYAPYAPSANGYNAYTPATTSHATSYEQSYDPYKPSQAAPAQHVGQSSSTYAQFVNGSAETVPQVEAPARSAAAAAQYRPKTFNAYDPPIPPPKAAPKRSAAWQSPVTSPAQVAYSSLPGSSPVRSAQSPALPPPPRKASVPPPPPRTGSAARQYAGSPVPPPLPHAHAPYGVHQPPPPNATPPPPRTGSAARHFATPPLPSTQYNSPPASSYIPSPPSHQSAPPPPVYQSPPPPSTYQSPSPPSAYQPPPPPSAYASHQPPPQETVSPATVTPPVTQDPYGPGNVADHSHPASEIPAETSGADAVESPWDEIPTQAVEEAGNPPTEHIPSDSVFDPEADEVEREAVDHTTGQEEAVSLTSVPETHEHHPASTGLEAVADEEYDPEGGQLEEDEGYKVDAHANASEAYASQTSPPQPASIASAAPAESVYDPYRPAPAAAPAVPPYGNAGNNPYSPPAPLAYSPRQSAEADRPTAVSSPPSAAPAPRSSVGSYAPSPYAYEPASTAAIPRTASPSSFSVRSSKSTHSVHDPYAPTIPSTISTGARYRSMSNGSMLSTTSVPEDPYAPAPHSRQQSTDSYSYSVSHATPSLEDDSSLVTPTTSSHAQVVTLTAPTRSQYAPSPSLLGSNDPLGRTSVRVPVFTFGFGGKIVTCFHGSEMLQTGFDVAMSSKASTSLRLRQLSSIIPQSAMETSTATYPGPLFSDPGTPTTTLVRPGAAAHAKAKKAKVVKYLEERAEEITQGLGYLHQGSVELYRAEAKRALINLVKVMVENDGKLSGTPQIDAAVRAVLVPGTEPASESSEPGTAGVRSAFELTSSSYGSLSSLGYDSKGVKLADHPLWSAQLDKIETLLVRGDRRGAFHYAADEKLWAHAMVIASSIDKEAWKEVVTEFVRSELSGAGAVNGVTATPGKPPSVDRREPLRVAYSLFAGQGSGSVQELHPPKALGTATQSLSAMPPSFSASTPLSAGFQQPVQPVELSKDVLMKWPTTAAMMIGSPLTVESSSALTALGDHLAFNGWHEAAHVCYLLSPQTSMAGGVGTPGGRVVLYGSPSPVKAPTVCKDPDAVIFSEIVEYALSLATPSKGQEPFHGLAYLQPYRLLRATYLAELGHIGLAKRYCEAISSSINRPSPYLNITFLEQLKDLTDRLIAAPMMDKSGSWIGSKMAKPSLDKIGNWLEGRFTSFIAGEGDSPNPAHNSSKVPTFSGPFAHFSSISSATNSTMPSPHMSSTNLADMQAQAQPAAPPFRTGSAMALRTSTTSPAQIARASSAIDYLRRKPSPVPRVSSAGVSPVSTLSAQSPYGYPNGYAPSSRPDMSTPTVQEDAGERSVGPQIASWWGAGESESATPTATTFAHPDEAQQPSSSEGFISLIDTPGFSGPSSTTQAQFTAAAQAQSIGQDALDDEEDLGFGNNSSRKKSSPEAPTEPGKADATPAPAAEKPKEAEKPAASGGGWLSRLWKRSDSSGPVKANLGEENTFYYDPEQKRWVNKNAPPEAAKPTPPPPPPARAQTASPGMASARGPPPPSPMHPPPARPATAIDLTDGPSRKPPMRIRSNLAPPEGSSAPTTPGSAPPPPRTPNTMMDGPPGLDAPPTPGARRAPAKRNARNRYVDVFQQQ